MPHASTLAAALLLPLSLLAAPAAAHDAGAVNLTAGTVRVVAEAVAVVKPDLAVVDVGVTTDRPTAEAATSENARKMDQLVAALKKEVGAGGEVKTVGFHVFPRYGEPKPGASVQPIVAYTVNNTVRLRTAEVNAVGRLIDRAFKLGANTVGQVSFTLKDPEPAQTEALRAAAAKARARATAMTTPLGLKVANVVSISEGEDGPTPLYAASKRQVGLMAAEASTPIEAGSLEVRAVVTVIFAIAGR